MEDMDLSLEDFVARVNSDLVGKYVNIASRTAPFIHKYFKGTLSVALEDQWSGAALDDIAQHAIDSAYDEELEKLALSLTQRTGAAAAAGRHLQQRAADRRALRSARVRQGAAPGHGAGGPVQSLCRSPRALGSGQGFRAQRRADPRRLLDRAQRIPPAHALPQAGAAARRARRRAVPEHRAAELGPTHRRCCPPSTGSSRTSI